MPPVARPLALTRLEDRATPALFGLTWMNNDSVSVSFAPDGTDVGGQRSQLAAALGRTMPTATWQTEVRRAFQAWTPATNVNFRFVGDDAAAYGSSAPYFGAATRGDIRVSARPLSDNVLIITNPPDLISDWAGEIVVNSNKAFTAGGGAGTVDLYTAMLQEVGHALGVGNSPDPASAMYESYQGPRAGLAAGDVAAAQKLYGVRGPDRFEGAAGNDTPARATPVGYATLASQLVVDDRDATPFAARADLTAAGDADVYKFSVPLTGLVGTNVLLKASDRSQLAGRLTVADALGRTVGSAAAAGPGRDVLVSITGLVPGQAYTVRADAADGRFAVGAYTLAVSSLAAHLMSPASDAAFATADGQVDADDGKSHGTHAAALDLGRARPATDARWDVVGYADPEFLTGRLVAKIQTRADTPGVMLATVWTDQLFVASPRLEVTDAAGKAYPARTLRSDGYVHLVQVENVTADTTYYLSAKENLSWWSPRLWLGVDFRRTPIKLDTFARGDLDATRPDAARGFAVTRSQLVRFELSGKSRTDQGGVGVRLEVADAAGNRVFKIDVGNGETRADDVLLPVGAYTVRVTARTTDGRPLDPVRVVARLAALTDPIGPEALDADGSAARADGGSSPPNDPGYAWDPWYAENSGSFWM